MLKLLKTYGLYTPIIFGQRQNAWFIALIQKL